MTIQYVFKIKLLEPGMKIQENFKLLFMIKNIMLIKNYLIDLTILFLLLDMEFMKKMEKRYAILVLYKIKNLMILLMKI